MAYTYFLKESLGESASSSALSALTGSLTFARKIIAAITKSGKKEAPATAAPAVAAPAAAVSEEEFSSGSLKLKNCDEKTAAMIMAIVSDNTGIPLSELIFKSITLVEEK